MLKEYKKYIYRFIDILPLIMLSITILIHYLGNLSGKMISESFIGNLKLFTNIHYILMILLLFIQFFLKKFSIHSIALVLLISLFLIYLTYNNETIDLMYRTTIFPYFLLIVLCKDIKYEIVIKTILISSLVFIIFTFLFAFGNRLAFHMVVATDNRIRYGIGFYWHSFTFIICYIIYYYIYIRKENISYCELAGLLLLSLVSFYLSGTKSCLAYEFVILLFAFIIKCFKLKLEYKKYYTYILILLIVVVAVGIVILTLHFNESIPWMKKIDSILTGRLYLSNISFSESNISLLGGYKEFIGFGEGANYVDSSFLRLILIYGAIFYLLFVLTLIYFARMIGKKKDIYLLFIFAIVIIQSAFDTTTMFTMLYNNFLFILSYTNSCADVKRC